MNILLTGASGYLGSHLARVLVSDGYRLTVLKREGSDIRRIIDIGADLACYDIESGGVQQAFRGASYDAVVHTATCYGRGGESAADVCAANTAWPLELMDAAASAGTPLFINTDTSLERFLNPYALSKKQFTDWGHLFADQGRIRFVNVVLEHFYGPGDLESKFVTKVIRSCLRGDRRLDLTAGIQRRDFIHIDDVVAAYTLILRHALVDGIPFQEFCIGSGTAIAIRDLVVMIRALSGSDIELHFGAVPLRTNEPMESLADTSALQALGWQPRTGLEGGLSRTIEIEKELMKGKTP